jgi:hypothetical protein
VCVIFDLECQAVEAAQAGAESVLGVVADLIVESIGDLVVQWSTWWVHAPSPEVSNPAGILQQWMLPFTILVATGGILWQALLMILTRRGEPLVNVLKGLAAVAAWGAVAVAGTNLLLEFSDSYSTWVLTTGLDGNIDALAERMLAMIAISPSVGLTLISSPLVMLAVVFQLVLLMFRNGAVIILTGLLQLAAAGSFTNGTSTWLRKLLSWHLALVFYKPMAATIYAIAFMLIGDAGNQLQTWLTGVGMLGLTIIALPAMLRFLNWTLGGIQNGSGGLGMLAAASAAGIHGAASLRGVTDHARVPGGGARHHDPGPARGAAPGAGGQLLPRAGPGAAGPVGGAAPGPGGDRQLPHVPAPGRQGDPGRRGQHPQAAARRQARGGRRLPGDAGHGGRPGAARLRLHRGRHRGLQRRCAPLLPGQAAGAPGGRRRQGRPGPQPRGAGVVPRAGGSQPPVERQGGLRPVRHAVLPQGLRLQRGPHLPVGGQRFLPHGRHRVWHREDPPGAG